MATEKQIAANAKNAQLSTGPKTAAGRERSSMNSYRHGMRSRKRKLMAEEGYFFENRKHKWLGQFDASDDVSEGDSSQNPFVLKHSNTRETPRR